MTCKNIYSKLLSLRSKFPPTCEKRLLSFGYQKDDLRKLYLLPFEVTKEVKLSMFQYKIIHNILCTKSLLFKMKKEDSPRCPLCPADHATGLEISTRKLAKCEWFFKVASLKNILQQTYASTGIFPVEFRLKTKTFRITRKNAGFRSVTGQQFYVEPMLNLATRGPACVCSTGVLCG